MRNTCKYALSDSATAEAWTEHGPYAADRVRPRTYPRRMTHNTFRSIEQDGTVREIDLSLEQALNLVASKPIA